MCIILSCPESILSNAHRLFSSLLPSLPSFLLFSPTPHYPNSLEKKDLSWEVLFEGISFLKLTSLQVPYKEGTILIPTTRWDIHHKEAKPRSEPKYSDSRAHAHNHICILGWEGRAELSVWVCSRQNNEWSPQNVYTWFLETVNMLGYKAKGN